MKKAVERMMPSGPLANKQLKNLKIYSGSEHPHVSQKPELLDFKSMNDKMEKDKQMELKENIDEIKALRFKF